jgi:hypothetical protein
MKKILILVFAISSLWTTAQDYTLFNSASKKVFTEFPEADSTYSFSFDSVLTAGSDSVYYPYYGVEDYYITSENCEFWGPPDCRPQIQPIWIGRKIIADNAGIYWFFNNQGDTLKFDFGMQAGGTSWFYKDTLQHFKLLSEDGDTMSILGMVDSVKTYRILHTDLQGNTINSALNNQAIIIGKNFGLVRFFQVDRFPEVLNPLAILGNSSPEAGLHTLTNAMIYDHQPGDEIEYFDSYSRPAGPPWQNYQRYIKHTFLSRNESDSTISYQVARFTFYKDSLYGVSDTIQLNYQKEEVIAQIPYDAPGNNWILENRSLYIDYYFGLPLWSYRVVPEHLVYCEAENCWGPYDSQGPPQEGDDIYTLGLGIYLHSGWQFGAPPNGYGFSKRIIYFKKNGISYGNEVVVGIQQYLLSGRMEIYPNPASDKLFLEMERRITGKVKIYNISGQMLLEVNTANIENGIDISRLRPGMYFVEINGLRDSYLNQKAMGKFIKL